MLRVGFNGRLLSDPAVRGWTRYTVQLLAHLPRHGVRPIIYAPTPPHPVHLPAGDFDLHVGPPMRYLAWEQLWLPRRLRRDRIDLFHTTFHFGLPWGSPCPRVLTLHDAIEQVYALPALTWRQRWGLRYAVSRGMLWATRRRADRVITDSEHAKGDLVRHLGLPADRVSVVPLAADERFHTPVSADQVAAMRAAYGLCRPYVFYVGGWERRKNVRFLLAGFAAAGLDGVDLVLAGGPDAGREGSVIRLGRVPDADLPALYAGAVAFIYPSEYEGFGLQLCEAMATGCPVLAARATSLPEVLGDGGETFALGDPAELAGLLRRVTGDSTFRAELANRAKRRAGDFSWDRTAEATVAVYRAALS